MHLLAALTTLGLGSGATLGACVDSASQDADTTAIATSEITSAEEEVSGSCPGTLPGVTATEAFARNGRYGFATRDFVFVDPTRPTQPNNNFPGAPERTLPTRVWYPACSPQVAASPPPSTRVPVASGGPFPLLSYAHGLSSLGDNARLVAEHLATHGYITVAPRFPLTWRDAPGGPTIADVPNQPADLAFVMRSVAQLGGSDADLAAAVDASRQGIMGLSAGGLTVLLAAYHPILKIEGIQSAVAMAPVSCFLGPAIYGRSLPTMIIAGTADELVPIEGPKQVFQNAPPPVTLLKLLGGTHSGFMDREVPFVNNTDTRACQELLSFDPTASTAAFAAAITSGIGPGAINPTGCTPLCSQQFTQTMGATRQLRLTRAATLAHFEATLKGRLDAKLFLKYVLDYEAPDAVVLTKH